MDFQSEKVLESWDLGLSNLSRDDDERHGV